MAFYARTQPQRTLDVTALYTIHYFEYYRGYRFQGESHDFWEFIYADRGALHVRAGEDEFTLRQGQLAFHPPGQFHTVATAGNAATNAIVVSFECRNEKLNALAGQVHTAAQTDRQLLSDIVEEARSAFSNDLGDPGYSVLVRRDEGGGFAAEQYIMLMLETLLIRLIRRMGTARPRIHDTHGAGAEYFAFAAQHIDRNIDTSLSVEQISAATGVSPSHLERLCRHATGKSVIQYCRARRIERARELLREGSMTITSVAAATGFASVHYFSRTFKAIVGMSPREYVSSIKSMTELPNYGQAEVYTQDKW